MSSSDDTSENDAYHGYNGDQFYGEVLKIDICLLIKLVTVLFQVYGCVMI